MGVGVNPTREIKVAGLEHLDALCELEQKGFIFDRFTRSQFRYLLQRANATTLIITESDIPIAAAIMLWRKRSPIGRLYTIVVDPSRQGQGLGQLLLQDCETAAVQRGCERIMLEVRADNKTAIALYERNGFIVERDLPGYYEDGCNGLRMRKLLV
jgi:ribosomal protein S18 acetylase RimI-like enzyme